MSVILTNSIVFLRVSASCIDVRLSPWGMRFAHLLSSYWNGLPSCEFLLVSLSQSPLRWSIDQPHPNNFSLMSLFIARIRLLSLLPIIDPPNSLVFVFRKWARYFSRLNVLRPDEFAVYMYAFSKSQFSMSGANQPVSIFTFCCYCNKYIKFVSEAPIPVDARSSHTTTCRSCTNTMRIPMFHSK